MAFTPHIIVIVGPTSSGKSELAVRLAKKHNGEILSADSRQVYRGMDIGTGKITGQWHDSHYVYKRIPHYGIDIASPKRQYSVARFQTYAKKVLADMISRRKTPIICGGTAHWIDAVVFSQQIPAVKPNKQLRKKLEKKSTESLFKQLQKLDPARAKTIDRHNPRRLIRALEIVIGTGKPVPRLQQQSPYHVTWVGINPPQDTLFRNIEKRLKVRLRDGMIHEVQKLKKQGLSWRRLESFGLEYKLIALYLQKKLSYEQMYEQLLSAIKHYSKRQLTWWKRNKHIRWISSPKI